MPCLWLPLKNSEGLWAFGFQWQPPQKPIRHSAHSAPFGKRLRDRHLDLMDQFGSTECLQTPSLWICLPPGNAHRKATTSTSDSVGHSWPSTHYEFSFGPYLIRQVPTCFPFPSKSFNVRLRLGVSTNYFMHGFIWNYPTRFTSLCQKQPLKSLGSHPVDVFASLEARALPAEASRYMSKQQTSCWFIGRPNQVVSDVGPSCHMWIGRSWRRSCRASQCWRCWAGTLAACPPLCDTLSRCPCFPNC